MVLPTHINCAEAEKEFQKIDVRAEVFTDRETGRNCWNEAADDAEKMGLSVITAVCPQCPYETKCRSAGYLAEKRRAEEADVLICTHARAASKGLLDLGRGRQYQSVHEDAVNLLRPTDELSWADLLHARDVLDEMLIEGESVDDPEITGANRDFLGGFRTFVQSLVERFRSTDRTTLIELPESLTRQSRVKYSANNFSSSSVSSCSS